MMITQETIAPARNGRDSGASEHVDTLVIGGGQAGLSAGYQLARKGLPFVIVDANERIGDAWRNRWDSLRLFTPAMFNGLAGTPFPAHPHAFPTKDEMADYLEAYARRWELPIRPGTRVERLSRNGRGFVAVSGDLRIEADNVVVAMASYQVPKRPDFGEELDPSIVQFHSVEYRNPSQLRTGDVLLVGAGNTGSELAMELARHGHRVWMSGRDTGHIPFRIEGQAGLRVLVRLVLRLMFHRVLTVDTPIGRRVRAKMLHKGGPLIRVKPKDLKATGVRRVPKMTGIRSGKPVLADGRVLEVANVIWCTGFHPGFSWIDLPIMDELGDPRHEKGVVKDTPGLYFIGLHFLYALSSGMVHGLERDAERIAAAIAVRRKVDTP